MATVRVDLERVLLVLWLADGWTFRARSVKETKPAGTVCYHNEPTTEKPIVGAPVVRRIEVEIKKKEREARLI